MIYSMTGYATRSFKVQNRIFQLDIRSFNHRFFDFSLKCPDDIKKMEYDIRYKVSNKITRGKIDIRITEYKMENENINLKINEELIDKYIKFSEFINSKIVDVKQSSVAEILNMPGVLTGYTYSVDEIAPSLFNEIDLLIYDLSLSQRSEGSKLNDLLIEKINIISNILNKVKAVLPGLINNYKQRLSNKLYEVISASNINDVRLQQEMTYFCQKIDVEEELSRLYSHINQFLSTIKNDEIVGKKLDFIIQEMHREVNTFGAKSVSILTTNMALELKILIEQLREQVQNIL